MEISIRPITEKEYERVRAFQCEYLDWEEMGAFLCRVEANPDLYLGAFDGDELVGICYGHPSGRREGTIQLQGIAVTLDETKNYARRGIGSRLIASFEDAARNRGYREIGVGAADDLKVESFYLKNGFQAYELVAKGPNNEEYERVQIQDYESGKLVKQELFRKYNPKEVIYIFRKAI